ncbi:hypothetical protein N431DRAFT_437528, partial [Stipitochalara longipes BDJ]
MHEVFLRKVPGDENEEILCLHMEMIYSPSTPARISREICMHQNPYLSHRYPYLDHPPSPNVADYQSPRPLEPSRMP